LEKKKERKKHGTTRHWQAKPMLLTYLVRARALEPLMYFVGRWGGKNNH